MCLIRWWWCVVLRSVLLPVEVFCFFRGFFFVGLNSRLLSFFSCIFPIGTSRFFPFRTSRAVIISFFGRSPVAWKRHAPANQARSACSIPIYFRSSVLLLDDGPGLDCTVTEQVNPLLSLSSSTLILLFVTLEGVSWTLRSHRCVTHWHAKHSIASKLPINEIDKEGRSPTACS